MMPRRAIADIEIVNRQRRARREWRDRERWRRARLGAAAGVELRVAAVGGAAGDPETAVADDGLHQTRVVGQDERRGDLQLDDRGARQRGQDHLDISGGRQHDGTVHPVRLARKPSAGWRVDTAASQRLSVENGRESLRPSNGGRRSSTSTATAVEEASTAPSIQKRSRWNGVTGSRTLRPVVGGRAGSGAFDGTAVASASAELTRDPPRQAGAADRGGVADVGEAVGGVSEVFAIKRDELAQALLGAGRDQEPCRLSLCRCRHHGLGALEHDVRVGAAEAEGADADARGSPSR